MVEAVRCASTCRSISDPFVQLHRYASPRFLSYSQTNRRLDRQHVSAVAHSHERTAKRMAINLATNFHQARGGKELHRSGPHNVSPATLLWTLLQNCCEAFV